MQSYAEPDLAFIGFNAFNREAGGARFGLACFSLHRGESCAYAALHGPLVLHRLNLGYIKIRDIDH
jgi:hypothetical protein